MDLSNLKIENCVEQGAEMTVMMPDGIKPMKDEKGKDVTITLLGKDAAAYRQKERELGAKYVAQMTKGKTFKATDEDECSKLSVVTIGWSSKNFSQKAAFDLYMNHPFIREQVREFVETRANFYKG